jgi:hypothetical protein
MFQKCCFLSAVGDSAKHFLSAVGNITGKIYKTRRRQNLQYLNAVANSTSPPASKNYF